MGSHKPFVYVVVLNWNGWPDTLKCLNSLEMLDYPNYRVVVVDNGSSDDSVDRIKTAFPNVELIEAGRNLGFAAGNNLGIRFALERGVDYVWLLNNDTKVCPHALTAMVEVAESDPKIGAVGSVLYYMDKPERVQAWGGGWVNPWLGISRHFLAPVSSERIHYITGASLLIRRSVLEEVGLLDEGFFMYWEDTDFGLRLRKRGYELSVSPNSVVFHAEMGSIGGPSPTFDFLFTASLVRFLQKHSFVPILSIVVSVAGRLMKRIIRGEFSRFKAVVAGLLVALKDR